MYCGLPPLCTAYNIVVIDSDLHGEFDAFKQAEAYPEYSLLAMTQLLEFWYKSAANKLSCVCVHMHIRVLVVIASTLIWIKENT